jgi:hypothetical protein
MGSARALRELGFAPAPGHSLSSLHSETPG